MHYLFSLLLSYLFFTVHPTPEVNGWQKATWGMKEAELVKAVPEARLLEKPEIYGRNLYAPFAIPDYEVLSLHFRVSFQMDSATKSLHGVVMKYLGKSPKELFENVGRLLIEKYGAPTDKEETDPTNRTWIWVFPKTMIEVTYFNEPSIKFEALTVHYSSTATSEAQKF